MLYNISSDATVNVFIEQKSASQRVPWTCFRNAIGP